MKCTICMSLAACLLSVAVTAANVFVAPDGDDDNSGTLAEPLRTIQKGVDALAPGDTCFVRSGVYRETVTLGQSGEPDARIGIRAYPGETVVLDGTEPLAEGWERGEGAIFSTHTAMAVEQLFAGQTMLVEARWPNCTLDRMLTRYACRAPCVPSLPH